ncbi:MAG: undecaprenyldiphospho-muramoylpentapeptide beta-N-acetylglucosaminyltransferase [Acidimicrobiales bacterium]
MRQRPEEEMYALICGGGTAGHVLPAIAIGEALVARGHGRLALHFVGSEGRIEETLVPEAGFSVTLLPGRGIQRRLAIANIGAVIGTARALWRALGLVRRSRPRVVVAMGGFASVPCALAAVALRVPIVVAEQNAVPGAANRLIARFAKAAAVSFPGTELPRAVVTGNPVRSEILARAARLDRDSAKRELGVPTDRSLVVVVGGSLGARKLNVAVLEALAAWSTRDDIAVRHVVGERDWAEMQMATPQLASEGVMYTPVRYERAMPVALDAADVAVCRSGSSTCFELFALGLPAVLVPSPFVTGDHQSANARYAVDAGAAVLVPDSELDGARLVAEVDALLGDPVRRTVMAAAARKLARPAAASDIAELIEHHARGQQTAPG